MSLRKTLRVTLLALIIVSTFTLAGCSPISSGMITLENGNYRLEPAPGCAETYSEVTVKYVPPEDVVDFDFSDLELVWSIEFKANSGITSVVLFEDFPDAPRQTHAKPVDLGRRVQILWRYEGSDMSGPGLVGILGDITPENVLWENGIEPLDGFTRKASRSNFSCR